MSYRNDTDAAFERADALQDEVDRQAAMIAALRRQLAHVEEPPPVVEKDTSWSAETTMIFYAMMIVLLFAIVMVSARY